MNVHIQWIKEQLQKAQEDLREAQKRVDTWSEALRLALREEKGQSRLKGEPVSVITYRSEVQPRARKIIDSVETILRDGKPRSAARLQKILERKGITTSANSINTSLNRFKGTLFEKNEDGMWLLQRSPDELPSETDDADSEE